MSKTKAILGGLLLAVAFAAVAFGSSVLDRGTDAEAAHTPNDVVSIRHSNGDPGPFGAGTVLVVPVGGTFNAEFWADLSSASYLGYQWEFAYDPTYLVHTGVFTEHQSATYSNCAIPNATPFGPFILYAGGCLAGATPANAFIGKLTSVEMQCIAATNVAPFATAFALVALDPAEDALTDPTFGSTYIDTGGVNRPTSTRFKGPNPAGGTIAQIAVVCVDPVDVAVDKVAPASAIVGAAGQYTVTITNNSANPPALLVDMSDSMPVGVTATAVDNGPNCVVTGGGTGVQCTALNVPANMSVVVTIDVTFDTCGNKNNGATIQLNPNNLAFDINPANDSDNAITNVDCAVLTVTKTGPAGATVGDNVVYNIQICNDAGGTAATNVNVSDVASGAAAIYGPVTPAVHASIASGACANSTVNATLTNPGVACNTASATQDAATGGPSNNSQACTTVSAAGVPKGIIPGGQSLGNVFLCKTIGTTPNIDDCSLVNIVEQITMPDDVDTCNDDDDGDGEGCNRGFGPDGICGTGDDVSTSSDWDGDLGDLEACENESGADCADNVDDDGDGVVNDGCPEVGGASETGADCLNAVEDNDANGFDGAINDGCPTVQTDDEIGEGLGAFEMQIKFDHKIFQHPTLDFADTVVDDTGRAENCTHDIITENWVLFGCTTKAFPNPGAVEDPDCVDTDGGTPGVQPADPADTTKCNSDTHEGPSVDGTPSLLVTVTFQTQSDLLERIRPTKDNGLRADLLDENCEAADVFGSPYNMEVEDNGSNEAPNGGLTDNCRDAVITVRMLEGDIDLDCDVDVVDDQMIAFRYGATFGILSYDPFFDLEPNTTPTDFDIDIKDLQFVFGRNGSTCLEPIPDQDPQPAIPDP
jgi:hypothetical protein